MSAVETLKRCTKCGEDKPRSEFHKRSASKDGLFPHCKSCWLERCRRFHAENRDVVNARVAVYAKANPKKIKAKAKRQYEENKEHVLARHAAWRKANPDYHKDRDRREYDANPERWRRASAKYRATLKGNGHEPYQRIDIYDRDEGVCHLCGGFVEWDDFSIDHVIPISKGGPDTPANVATSHLLCNLSRGAKPLNRGGQ